MKVEGLRHPYARAGGNAYFVRMCNRIRLGRAGKLPAEYHEIHGGGFQTSFDIFDADEEREPWQPERTDA